MIRLDSEMIVKRLSGGGGGSGGVDDGDAMLDGGSERWDDMIESKSLEGDDSVIGLSILLFKSFVCESRKGI